MSNSVKPLRQVAYKKLGIDGVHFVLPGKFSFRRNKIAIEETVLDIFGGQWRPYINRSNASIALNESKIKESMRIGMHILISKNRIEIQFKGLFWLFAGAFQRCKLLCEQFQKLSKEPMYISQIDIRRDFWDRVCCSKLIPMPSDETWWSFHPGGAVNKWEVQKKVGQSGEVTQYEIQNSRTRVILYRKDLENTNQKNKTKKDAYAKLLKQRKMIRCETRLKGSDSCKIATYKFFECANEGDFCRDVLGSWAMKHSIRTKPSKWDKTPPRCWPQWKGFRKMFFRDVPGAVKWQELTKEKKLTRFRTSTAQKDPHKLTMKYIAEMKNAGVCDIIDICEHITNSEDQADCLLDNWKNSAERTFQFLEKARLLSHLHRSKE